MPNEISKPEFASRFDMDTFGCGARFSQQHVPYPHSSDLDQLLSSQCTKLSQSKSHAGASSINQHFLRDTASNERQHYMPVNRETSKDGNNNDKNGKTRAAQPDLLMRWQRASRQEMPWDGIGAVDQTQNQEGGDKGSGSCDASSLNFEKRSWSFAKSTRS